MRVWQTMGAILEDAMSNDSRVGDILQAFMEEIRHDIRSLDSKLDAIMTERRNEARETGEQTVRLAALERWRDNQEAENNSTRKIALGAIVSSACAAVGFMLLILARVVAEHPTVVK